ncbi:FkbM family methyltransferase [Brachyspira intermedia]|uniref:FkbM family methyltransferase n=1 Tax=Brachyspira intermedia TaxID=84377 RepID=UPI00300640B2
MDKVSKRIAKYIPSKKIRNYLIEIIDIIEDNNLLKNMDKIKDIVNKLVWYIPIKQLRDDIRKIILDILELKTIYSKNYLQSYLHHKDIYSKLISKLNESDINLINNIIFKYINDILYINEEEFNKLKKIEDEHNAKIKSIDNNKYVYDDKYILIGSNFFEIINFYDRMFIDTLNNPNYFKNKAIIDAGAWIGDTALVLSEYTNDKVYAFEPVIQNINIMQEVVKINKKNNIVPVCLALGDKNKTIKIADSKSNSYLSFNGDNKINVDMVTLDKFVEDNNITVGLIKTDLEGFEQPFLRGAINTIKKQRPTLIISIYHNFEDFFEIKPMIESWNLGYKFSIKKGSEFHTMIGTLLIAEIS